MESFRLFVNSILIINIILSIYYFYDLESYCVTDNQECINDPKRELIIDTSILILIFIGVLRYFKINGKIKSNLLSNNVKMLLYFGLISMTIVSIYRVYIIYQYIRKLKQNCNCKEYTVEYYIIKYHNLFQIFGLFLTFLLFIITILFIYYYKKKIKY